MFTKAGFGYLARSDFYEEGGNKPEFYGKITIGEDGDPDVFVGELAAWVKTNDSGKKYFSIAVSVKTDQEEQKDPKTEPETEDDVPF